MSSSTEVRRSKKALLLIVFAPFFCFAAIVTWVLPNRETNIDAMRCAENATRLKILIARFMERAERFPGAPSAEAAFGAMARAVGQNGFPAGSRETGCPESIRETGSMGYVYVAGGIDTQVARKEGALIFFCPATSHRQGREHAHAVRGDGQLCASSNEDMIQILETALEDATAGRVRYSSGAVDAIRQQLTARRGSVTP